MAAYGYLNQMVSAGDIAILLSDHEWGKREFDELQEEILYQLPDDVQFEYVQSMHDAIRHYEERVDQINRQNDVL